jgi:hypothetical protein
MSHHEYFHPDIIELQKEIQRHPPLAEIIKQNQDQPFVVLLGHVAAYCNVIVDGSYNYLEIVHVCGKLVEKLQDKRAGHVILH